MDSLSFQVDCPIGEELGLALDAFSFWVGRD